MGKKNLLRTINITDRDSSFYQSSYPGHSSSYTNHIKASVITTVYDSDEDLVETFALPFEDIAETAIGFGGDFYTARNYGALDDRLIGYLNTGSDIYGYREVNRAYIADSGSNDITIADLKTGEEISSFNTDLTNPISLRIVESSKKLYVLDDSAQRIYVFNIATPDSPVRLSSEDIDISSMGSIVPWMEIHQGNNEAVLFDYTNDTFYKWNLSSGTSTTMSVVSETYTTFPFALDEANDKIYFSTVVETIRIYNYTDGTRNSSAESSFNTFSRGVFSIYSENQIAAFQRDTGALFQPRIWDTQNGVVYFSDSDINGLGTSVRCMRIIGSTLYTIDALNNWSQIELVSYPSALVSPLAIDRINDNIGLYWESIETDYGFLSGDNFTYFKPLPAPPFMLKRSIPLSEIDGNDLELPTRLSATVKTYSEPTEKRSQNGSITLLANGGTPPYIYQAIGQDGRNEDPQVSPTFSSLNPGNYSFRVTDSNRVNFDLPKFTLTYRSTSFGDYGLIYTHQFTDVAGNIKHRIEIFDRDATDNNINIDAGILPITYVTEANGQDVYDLTILKSTINVNLIANSISTYQSFATADDERFACVWSVEDSGPTYNERWRGYLLPETYSQEYGSTPVNVYLSFTDRLADLKNIPYANRDVFNLNVGFTGGEKSQLDVICFCLKQLNMDMEGIRVAVDWFEENHDTTSTDTPLEQTFVDTDTYIERDEGTFAITDSWTLEEVITAILEPYSATLLTWEGYYWIVNQKNWLEGTSYNYVEFDMQGVQQSTGTQTNYIDFGANEDSNRWRWRGGKQTLTTTQIYRDVQLTLDTRVIEEGLAPAFITKNIFTYGGNNLLRTFDGYQVQRNAGVSMFATDENLQKINLNKINEKLQKCNWTFEVKTDSKTPGFIKKAGNITYSGTDQLKLKLKISTGTGRQGWIPYYTLKWKLRIGRYYYSLFQDTWTTQDIYNTRFIDSELEFQEIEYIISLRDVGSVREGYSLEIQIPTHFYYDVTTSLKSETESDMLDILKSLNTTLLSNGVRIVTRRIIQSRSEGDSRDAYEYYYFQLEEGQESGSQPDVVTPDDYNASTNDKRWRLEKEFTWVYFYGNGDIRNEVTTTYINEAHLFFLPNGGEAPTQLKISKAADTNNKVTLERSLRHFDAPPGINNSEKLYYNITKYDTANTSYIDTSNTNSWSDGGVSRRIQDHKLNWLVRLSKQGRNNIGGSIDYNTEISPLQSLRDPNDDNTRYIINGGSWDLRNNQIGGGFIEIGSDTPPSTKSIDNSADSNAAGE